MPVSSDLLAITGQGQEFSFSSRTYGVSAKVGNRCQAVITNHSGFRLLIKAAPGGPDVVPPMTRAEYRTNRGPIDVDGVVGEPMLATAVANIYVTWAVEPDFIPGTFPQTLPGTGTSTQQFLAASDESVPAGGNIGYQIDSFTFPPGLKAVNFHSATVAVKGTSGHISGLVTLYDTNSNPTVALPIVESVVFGGFASVDLPLPYGAEANSTLFVSNTDGTDTFTFDLILMQDQRGYAINGATPTTTL